MSDITANASALTPAGARDVPAIGVGMLGYGFMGRAHSNALRAIPHLITPRTLRPELVAIAGRHESAVASAAEVFGFAEYVTDWHALIADPRIELFDNLGPNDVHTEANVAAAQAGKHVICEKPLGRDADESYRAWQAVAAAGVKHMCAFNYRFVPAVRLAREMIERGELGEILHFRIRYLQDWLVDDEVAGIWRLDKAQAGSGALGDLGSHIVDLARFLVGEIETVSAMLRTITPVRGGVKVEVDDAFVANVRFANGVVGTLEASRYCSGHRNGLTFEVNGTKGSLSFNLERLNELEVNDGAPGFQTLLVSEPNHPFWANWWPAGHTIGWEHTFIHELDHFLAAIRGGHDVAPYGATFEDGYRAAEVCDAIVRAADEHTELTVPYRTLAD
jgi:predicted dehydrogenase